MEPIKGYGVGVTLYEGRECRVVRAQNSVSGEKRVLKLLKEQFPPPDVQSNFRYEYELTRRMAACAEGVIGVGDLKRHGRGLLMELEDFGAQSLEAAIAAKGRCLGDMARALDIAVRLAEIVGRIHAAHVTHKGLNPANILYNPDTGAVRIIDFGIATELTQESARTAGTDLPLAILHYISPEQTGRMNRSVDHRADLYGLGATLFHLFAGVAPFENTETPLDAIELIHAHIAMPPPRITDFNPDMPAMLDAIVARLLEKDVTARFQSALGIQTDLERCRTELRQTGKVARFNLGQSDQFHRLSPAQRLYGRDHETKDLLDCFERVRSGAVEFVFVHGYSGIGKSALVHELRPAIALSNGVFVSGKFDLNLRDQPYASFLQALQELIRRRLAESADGIEQLAAEIGEALGPNGQVIIDVIPEVELIIGPQPAVPELGPQETQNRFGRVFEEFLKVFAKARHPLVIFIDDLQWADGPSLNLMRRIASCEGLGHVVVIGAYRDNEVDAAHPLSLLRESLEAIDFPIVDIELGPLNEADVGALINDMLRQTASETGDFVQLCHRKTRGNPFFLNQFLVSLNEDALLRFDQDTAAWHWQLSDIEERNYTDNVVDLVIERIRRLPRDAEEALKIAACSGNRFDLFTLARLLGKPSAEVAQAIWPLLKENLLLPLTDSYRAAMEHGEDETAEAGANVTYHFLHDRVQQAAYSLLSDTERRRTHLSIGRSQQRGIDETSPREQWFNLLMHLNNAGALIETPDERRELAALNLAAGRRAKLVAAFEPAIEYLGAGLTALPPGSWETDYELALDLHVEAAEAAYLNHDFENMAVLGAEIASHAQNLMDRVRMHEIELRSLIAQDRRLDAIATALPLLSEIDAAIPAEPGPEDYGIAFGAAEGALAGREMSDIAALPQMTDPHACAAMRILSLIFSAAYFAAPQLLPLIIAKLVELSARHGNSSESAFGYAVYGLHLCAFAEEIERGYEFGRLSRAVLDQTDARTQRARTLFIANICVVHWKEPIHATLEPLLNAYQAGLDNGDIEYSTHALMIHNQHLYAVGHNLARLHERMAGHEATIIASKEEAALSLFQIYHQSVANWLGHAENPAKLIGRHYDETAMRPVHEQVGDQTALFHMFYNKTLLAYGFGDLAEARTSASETRSYLSGAVGVHQIPLFHFYESLVLLADADALDSDDRIAENQLKLHGWAEHCPENNMHRWHLVEAERHARSGDVLAAVDHFEKSAQGAQNNDFLQEEALAHERHAMFWLARGNRAIARTLMAQAE
ncbi:MAG: serine/threonine-protein kinase PknK [Proteobacteria bacterium]|nr:serine/threonine-protein kinase PknK [Pseudomonadota bacterium]